MLERGSILCTTRPSMAGRLRYTQAYSCCLALICIIIFAYCVLGTSYFAQLPVQWATSKSQRQYLPMGNQNTTSPGHRLSTFDLLASYQAWDAQVGCSRFRDKHELELETARNISSMSTVGSIQNVEAIACNTLKMKHVTIRVEMSTWIPDSLDNLYACRCDLACLWTQSGILADRPDALLYETFQPPALPDVGGPLRVFLNLEPGRYRSGAEELFVSYHADDDVQATYAGHMFHVHRNYYLSPYKNEDALVYWSSSRCVPERQNIAKGILSLLSHHSFGKCLNNMGDRSIFSMYPECKTKGTEKINHLHCAMSHYKFVLAIENTRTESYVTEKLFYALDVGAVPIYFGAPNILDFVPPHSFIDGMNFTTMKGLAAYVKQVAGDPSLYAEYHAWRRCGILGNYVRARAASLDSLPCRLCTKISERGGQA